MGRPFSLGYAYAQTQHYRDAVAAQRSAVEDDPFDGIEIEPEAAPAPVVQNLATDAQVGYAMSLARRNLGEVDAAVTERLEATLKAMTRREISRKIDELKAIPPAPRAPATVAVTEGMYRDPESGDIFKVQVAHHGSGNLYAKRLVKLADVRVKRGKEYSHDFEYVAGAINRIRPEWRMTKDEAIEWGQLYGACCKCGTILTDERSIEAGIGPICGASF